MIGLQELNLAYHYPIVYWNTACLIVNAGADESVEENKSTDYGKIATAISQMQNRGINISLPLINTADFGFTPDEQNNRIIYALKAINGIGDDVVRLLLENRPYSSFGDFCVRMIDTKLIKNSQMIQLIKAGCFVELDDTNRQTTMKKYLETYAITPCKKLTFAQFDRMIDLNSKYPFIPQSVVMGIRHKYFLDYVLAGRWKPYVDSKIKRKIPKSGYHDRCFILDSDAMEFFKEFYSEDSIVGTEGNSYIISEKKFKKENSMFLEPLREYMASDLALKYYNMALAKEAYDKYASGSIPQWEMESLSIYIEHHYLEKLPEEKYGVVNFFELPEEPEPYEFYYRTITVQSESGEIKKEVRKFPKYPIVRLAGTIIDKDKDKHLLTLLTTHGVVTCKLPKGQYLYYDRKVNEQQSNGKKKTLENSWFERGNSLLVCGHRSENIFRVHKYSDTLYKHCIFLITNIYDNGEIDVKTERMEVEDKHG